MTLYHMNIDDTAIIDSVGGSDSFRRRLFDLGIISGQEIRCINKGLFRSPVAYEICDSIIALRKNDAEKVGVSH